ncbi:hypothetical protein [Dysgonomonas gadei]|uniref:Beta-lactamase-inhibitor-like PepSY-like domain-containing protein n=1 Tax=Dysgonomonas gadei ATCC BAA-286 TaxID=742766 RepID=F5IZ51_9BACT|nr:hypothetical protein [Dysgonomonas gadei]EGK01340.1 hypothetical protein HMPREF9455_02368 [Dysgonomonas gadei ATCC BAA-286]
MKKIALLVFMIISIGSVSAIGANMKGYGSGYPHKTYYKGNISPEQLPETIKKYLDKNYPDHMIMVSKRKGNGKYFIKIRFGGNGYHSYYRSLVFDHKGSLIKG